jgi:hypothetical protein
MTFNLFIESSDGLMQRDYRFGDNESADDEYRYKKEFPKMKFRK